MASVVASLIEPDCEAIKSHLAVLFAPCVEHYPRGLIELRHGAAFQSSYFGINTRGLTEAAEFAAHRTREGANVYVGVNPRKPDTDMKRAASAVDVEIAFFHFADLDDADAVAAAGRRLKALPPTFTLTTGTTPHRRPHFYWQLEEPVRNMAAWTQAQLGIAQALDGDSVIDPPRIMRLAGTVNWPDQKKLQRGYKPELVTLKTEFEDEREPVTPEQVAAAYPVKQAFTDERALAAGETTLSAMRQTHINDLLEACRSSDQWHNNMIRLVGHLAAKGRSSAEIVALADHITLPGYSAEQTRREMLAALQGARSKWALPEPEDEPVEAEERAREEASREFEAVDAFDFEEADIPVRPWLVPGALLAGYTHMLAAPGGSGKSLFTLQFAIALATGTQWGEFVPRRKYKSLIVNVEDDIDEQRRRLAAAARVMGVNPQSLRGMIYLADSSQGVVVAGHDPLKRTLIMTPVAGKIRSFIETHGVAVLFADPFAETFEGDENDNSEVKWAMKIWRDEVARPTKAAVYLVHHTTKYAANGAGDANVIRGAGAIVNSTRISATLMPMTVDDAAAIGVDPEERHRFVRYDDAKANQSLLNATARWFRKETVELTNGKGLQEPDQVGALVPWSQPDAFAGVSSQSIKIALERIHRGMEDENGSPTGERYTLRKGGQTNRRWAGNPVMECLGIEAAQAARMLKTWLQSNIIEEGVYDDPVQRKERAGVTVNMTAVMQMGAQHG